MAKKPPAKKAAPKPAAPKITYLPPSAAKVAAPKAPPPPKLNVAQQNLAQQMAGYISQHGSLSILSSPGPGVFYEAPPPEDTSDQGIDISGLDVGSLLGMAGLPSDLVNQIIAMFKKSNNINDAIALSLGLVRGSDWYKSTFPGIGSGIAKGLFTDETGYRSYVNSLNQVYRRYAQRDVSGDETAAALAEGATPDLVGRRFEGRAYAEAHAPEVQYLSGAFGETGQLSADELKSYGEEQAGIDTPVGQRLNAALQRAMQRYQTVFTGGLATPSLSLTKGGLAAPSLQGQQQTPDVAA